MSIQNYTEFYLTSSDNLGFETPRKCHFLKRLRSQVRDNLMLISIDPPLIGQKYGLGGKDIREIMITHRFKGDSLFPIKKFPIYVHILRILNDNKIKNNEVLNEEDFELTAWGEIYATYDDAKKVSDDFLRANNISRRTDV